MLLSVHRNRTELLGTGSPGFPPRLSHTALDRALSRRKSELKTENWTQSELLCITSQAFTGHINLKAIKQPPFPSRAPLATCVRVYRLPVEHWEALALCQRFNLESKRGNQVHSPPRQIKEKRGGPKHFTAQTYARNKRERKKERKNKTSKQKQEMKGNR